METDELNATPETTPPENVGEMEVPTLHQPGSHLVRAEPEIKRKPYAFNQFRELLDMIKIEVSFGFYRGGYHARPIKTAHSN